jgi:hypothetical protein
MWGMRKGLKTSHRKKKNIVTKCYTWPQNWRAVVKTVMNLPVP